MSRFKPRDTLDRVFEIGIILKGLDGVLETVGGLLLLALTPATINNVLSGLTQNELFEDPHDFIASHLLGYAHGLTGTAVTFAAVYLLVHGITKIHRLADLARVAPTESQPWRRYRLSDPQVRSAGRKLLTERLPGMCLQVTHKDQSPQMPARTFGKPLRNGCQIIICLAHDVGRA
ncbi:MAG: DUF2127 domain-containing protein [Phycicoccus sp.]|nr:DUF2127 domain-containing protein [Phycicoccus sp.]NMM35779.1 DUF2127 domain-containing protein [Phycicoccus sp.]